MAQPPAYIPTYDFSDFEATNPTDPKPGAWFDIEFANVAVSISGIRVNLAKIQRDDGKLRNGIVTFDSLSSETKSLLGSPIVPRGAWVTATGYAVLDLVSFGGASYICAVAHTSGTFSTDLADGKWVLFAAVEDGGLCGTSSTSITVGTGSKGPLTTQENKGWPTGTHVLLTSDSDPANIFMSGRVTDYTGDQLTVDVEVSAGAGSHDDWTIRVDGERGPQGATGPQGPAGAPPFDDDVALLQNEADNTKLLAIGLSGLSTGVTRTINAEDFSGRLATQAKGSDIAAAGTLDLDAATGDYVTITGNTGITAITLAAGVERTLHFTGAPTLTHGANLICPGGVSLAIQANDVLKVRGEAASVVRVIGFLRSAVSGGLPKGYKGPFFIANGSDADHDLDISAWYARSDDDTVDIAPAAYTKQLDAGFATGNNAGLLDTGSIGANKTYFLFAIYNPTTGVSDWLASESLASPTMPSGFTKKIWTDWAFLTDGSSNIYPFKYNRDGWTLFATAKDDVAAAVTTSASLLTLTVPKGVKCEAAIRAAMECTTTSQQVTLLLTSPDETDQAPVSYSATGTAQGFGTLFSSWGTNEFNFGVGEFKYHTDTSGRIRSRATGTAAVVKIKTHGYKVVGAT